MPGEDILLAAGDLLERRTEVAALTHALRDSRDGSGRVVWIAGPAGIGKTSLWRQATSGAREAGFEVLTATGHEFERSYPFGVVQQLFEPALARREAAARTDLLDGTSDAAAVLVGAPRRRPTAPVDGLPAAIHGLYWLTANLAGERPLAIFVDDAQWSDAQSLRWCDYLARRIDGLPVALVVAARSDEPSARVAAPEGAAVLTPEPLSADGARALIARRLASPVGEHFAAAGHRATGGNPLLVEQLAAAVAERGWTPDNGAVERLLDLGTPETARFVLRRLEGLGDDAAAVGRALAVLGASATVDLTAALAGLDTSGAAAAADLLVDAGLLDRDRPLAFVHPLVEAAIRGSIPPNTRSRMHRSAAQLLIDRDVEPGRVAPHLLQTEPNDDPEVVRVLRAAAAEDAQRGAFDAAVRALARARREPPLPDVAHAVALELGRAELAIGAEDAVDHLREALERAPDPEASARAALDLGNALFMAHHPEESSRILERAIDNLGDESPELTLQLEMTLLSSAHLDLGEHQTWSRRVADVAARREEVPPPLRRMALGHIAQQRALDGRPPAEVQRLAFEALADGLLLEEQTSEGAPYYFAASALVMGENFEAARDAMTAAREEAERRGSPSGFALASCFRALPQLRLGALHAAEADLGEGLAVIEEHGVGVALPGTVVWLVECHLARGRIQAAQDVLDRFGMDGPLPELTWFVHLTEKRGALRVAQRRFADAVAELEDCARRSLAVGNVSVADVFWRSSMARALIGLDRVDEARAIASEEVALARKFGGRYSIGRALLGLVAAEPDGDPALAMLSEARAGAAVTGARLLEAQAMHAEGAMLRRLGQRTTARPLLMEALDLAVACGADGLAESVRDELHAAGARPRRQAASGPGALTPSELRIARLAASGESNRSIARSLFITEKTVETHLTATYAKLGVGSRRDLPEALAG